MDLQDCIESKKALLVQARVNLIINRVDHSICQFRCARAVLNKEVTIMTAVPYDGNTSQSTLLNDIDDIKAKAMTRIKNPRCQALLPSYQFEEHWLLRKIRKPNKN